MPKKRKRLPHNYLDRYLGSALTKADHDFILGCIEHQRKHAQINNVQWEIIKKIEKKYLSQT